MRIRLSAKFSIWFKILASFFLFLFSFILLTKLAHDPWPVWFTFSLDAVLLTGAYMTVQYFCKDRTVISFDQNNLYITDVKFNTEDVIPLEHVSWLNMRMNTIKMGAIWYRRYSIHYVDNYNQEQKVRLFIKLMGDSLVEFVKAAKAKNPDFRYKNWSWTFDLKD